MKYPLAALAAACALALPVAGQAGEITIRRDAYGMPHVYAGTVADLFHGYGYAVAQDRLFQMEMARRSTQGRVAEVLGAKFVAFDRSIRANFSPERIVAQLDALPKKERDILDGYASGMNAWLKEVRRDPAKKLAKQFTDLGFEPADWTAYDVAMVFVGTMANRFSDANTEVDNLALLTALVDRHGRQAGWDLFNQLKWLSDPKAATTIAPEEGRYTVNLGPFDAPLAYTLPRYEGTPPVLERLAQSPADRALLGLPEDANRAEMLAQIDATGFQGTAGFPTTSNMWIVGGGHAKNAKAMLLNGPQFGWFAPAYTYGIGLHGAGFDIVGNTPFAYPCILFGHNGRVAWGSTAGVGDGVDIFAEKLDPQDPTRYFHDGQWKRMDRRIETIQVKGGEPVTFDIYRTVHGLVTKVDTKANVAYAKARTWEGHEIASLLAWTHKGQAQNWTQWKQQAARHALTINWYYADRDGHIGYAHTGFYPKRQPGHDPRLPVPGTGEWDWQGVLPFSTNPQVHDPKQGYIANWNNQPMKDYPATDTFGVLWTAADRVTELESRLREKIAQGGVDAEGMWSLIKPTSLADVNRRHFVPFLQRAVEGLPADDARAAAVARLAAWDGLNSDERGSGAYDSAGGAILDAWLREMLKATLADDLPGDFFKWYAATGYPTPETPNAGSVNLSPGGKVLYNVLAGADSGVPQRYDFLNGQPQRELVLAALDAALAGLAQRYGGADPAQWRVPVAPLAFSANNFFGVPQGSADEARRVAVTMNRGTENNLIVFDGQGVHAQDVVSPGQSGFVAADGTPSPHARDQFDLYVNFQAKPVWFTKAEVARAARSTTRLRR